ncbi:transposase [Peredibacter starrii]|uniref:Transposase n=1 Tax=Peredibacter starrii TaxID=28202 RepID=A0AAX4HRI5_9BACT|nr:transposase [Peredibacter starrii]WPU65852.1 transposase [Peredibacter starrii]
MTRPLILKSAVHPYHVSARTQSGDFFPISLDEVWAIMLDELQCARKIHNLCIHAFVLMGNHFHLLCHTPNENLDQIMHQFMRNTSLRIRRQSKSSFPLWAGRYRWSLIESQNHYYQVYKYIYRNPIRAKMVSKVEHYPFSTLKVSSFPIHSYIAMSFAGEEGERLWLNEPFDKEAEGLIKLGLKKQYFDVNKRKLKIFNRLTVPNIPPHE